MAVFQSMFNFFLPSRRRAPLPSPATPQQAELMKGLEAAFAAIDELSLPDQIAENFKADLTDSLNIGTPITSFQGAYPGTLKRLRFNLTKVVQDPIGNTLGVLGEYVQSYGTDLKDWIDPDYY
ncbi:MAG: hypothetical protein KAJ19_19385, partial [Gammaproteobacteria bacterium]|nr:hypothetical protein [Gammaproteobacteria bacterium]